MKYEINKNKIIIYDLQDFNIKQILDCGQIFRYQINEGEAIVFSKDKKARVLTSEDRVVIETEDVNYFANFFDLKTDYLTIKKQLKKDKFLTNAIDYGYGIRILNNDTFEMIVSFIISANNNISRIKKSIEFLCEKFGSKKNDYFAFPTLLQLKNATVENFKTAGLGYRAEQLYETIQDLTQEQIEVLKTKTNEEKFNFLVSLKGVGEKVANCIMLFGLGVKNVFPVDTWINKVYNSLNNTVEHDRKKITKELSSRYGELSGYAQQYFFYYFRENKLK
ncbi:MAG: DNA-3-methyladenine glycosylase 2 family protein [Clostridia bacterium]|nr:DNA-3-methyladenine glycosylase 2 family protein [Clostridia bacterium]